MNADERRAKCGADALVRAGPPGPALPMSDQADQGVGRGPGGPPHKIVAATICGARTRACRVHTRVNAFLNAVRNSSAFGCGSAALRLSMFICGPFLP